MPETKQIHVLLIEDEKLVFHILSSLLGNVKDVDFQLDWAKSLKEGNERLAERSYGLIILDLFLPDSEGLATFHAIQSAAPASPIVILSATENEEMAIGAVRDGAQDYIFKGEMDSALLVRCLRYSIERAELAREVRQYLADLQGMEASFRSIITNTHDGAIVLSSDGEVLFTNPSALKILGRDRKEIRVKAMPFELGLEFQETTFTSDDDKRKTVQFRQFQIEWNWKSATCIILRDVTVEREVQAALAHSEERYALAAEAANDGLWEWDLIKDELYLSPRCKEMLGYGADEISSSTSEWFDRIHEEDRDYVLGEVNAHLEGTTERIEVDFRIRHRDGEYRWFTCRGKTAIDERGRPLRVAGSHADITERKEAQEKLVQKTLDLQQSNEDLQMFAHTVSHDLREPLRTISSFSDLIAERFGESLEPKAREYFAFVHDGAKRMASMLNGMLEYSRIESRGNPLEQVSMEQCFNEAMKNLSTMLEDAGAVVTHDTAPDLLGDRVQLTQLVQNLVSNSIKFCTAEIPRIHLAVHRARSGNPWIHETSVYEKFRLSDNGIGIRNEDRERVFEVYQRLHTRDEFEGTGMGLAICKRIVERHGGSIRIEDGTKSDGDKCTGTSVVFELPAAPAFS